MRKLVVFNHVSLDGYFVDTNGDMSWAKADHQDAEWNALKKARPENITEYIDAPKEAQEKLREMRACIREAAPGAEESLKWGKPAFSYRRILVMFAAFKHHI